MSMYGADVAELRALAARFDRTADQLDANRMAVGNAIQVSAWVGPFAARFRMQWNSEHSTRIHSAAMLLRAGAKTLRTNADDQERASAVDGSAGSVHRSAGQLRYPGDGSSPEDVRNWWQSLTKDQQDRLIRDDPLRIGNLNGVPIESRVEANRIGADLRLDAIAARLAEMGDKAPDVTPLLMGLPAVGTMQLLARERWLEERAALLREQAYLEAVSRGDRALVVYDPSKERIVEMIGSPGPNTKTVLTYLPGTSADMNGFYSGSTQQVATYLAQSDRSGGTVAFVYKDGPWLTWPLQSVGRTNIDMGFAAKEGAQLADFQAAMQMEPYLKDARTAALAHSAGMSILSASEVSGAHYDKELSLGGAMLAPGWHADSATDYYHYQYGVDAINYANGLGDLPAESNIFEQRVLAPHADTFLGVKFQNEISNHLRIASGPAQNQTALQSMYGDIHRD